LADLAALAATGCLSSPMSREEHGGVDDNEERGNEHLIFSRTEQRAIVIEVLKILPNVWQVYRSVVSALA
jgi:hypothetical protein